MLGYGHIASGIILGRSWRHLSTKPWVFVALGVFFAYLPDLDALYYFITHRCLCLGPDFTHHLWLTHTLPPYLIVYFAILLTGFRAKRRWQVSLAHLFIAGVTLHLLLDTVLSVDGIMWLYPFSDRQFIFTRIGTEHGMAFQANLIRSPWYLIEIVLYVGAAAVLGSFTRLRRVINVPGTLLTITVVDILLFLTFYRPHSLDWPRSVPGVLNAVALSILMYLGFMLLVFGLRVAPVARKRFANLSWRQLTPRSHSSLVLTYFYMVPVMLLIYLLLAYVPVPLTIVPWLLLATAIIGPSVAAYFLSTHIGQYGGLIGNVFGFTLLAYVGSVNKLTGGELWPFSLLIIMGFFTGWLGGWLARGQVIVSYHLLCLRFPCAELGMHLKIVSDVARNAVDKAIRYTTGRRGTVSRDVGGATLLQQSPGTGAEIYDVHREVQWRLSEAPLLAIMRDLFLGYPLMQPVTQLHEDIGNVIRFVRVRLCIDRSEDDPTSLRLQAWAYRETPSAVWSCTVGEAILRRSIVELKQEMADNRLQAAIANVTGEPLQVRLQPLGFLDRSRIEVVTREPHRHETLARFAELSGLRDMRSALTTHGPTFTIWSTLRRRAISIILLIVTNILLVFFTDWIIGAFRG